MSIFITGPVRINSNVNFNTTNVWSNIGATASAAGVVSAYGDLYLWGTGLYGQQGNNTSGIARSSPTQLGGQVWSKVVGGRYHWLGLKTDGTLWAWGYNTSGQLGLDDKVHRSSPTQIGTSSWTNICATTASSYAVRADGTLWAWGDNAFYQHGTGNTTVHRSSPVQVGTDTNWTNATFYNNGSTYIAFGIHVSVIKSDGSLWQWGTGNYTEIAGVAESEPVSVPLQIGTSSWISVGTTFGVTAAIRADGALFTWGVDDITRIDYIDGLTNRSSPVQIGTSSWTMVVGGNPLLGQFIAIRADGTLHTWGYDGAGTLGLNDAGGLRESPTQILSDRSFVTACSSASNFYALATDNTVWAWGAGTLGRNGDVTSNARSSPVQVALAALVS